MKTLLLILLATTLAATTAVPDAESVPETSAIPSDVAPDPGASDVALLATDESLLRELLVRLVAPYTGPNGQRGKIDVYTGALPAGLDLPTPAGAKLIGSVVKETPGGPNGAPQGQSIDVVIDAPGTIADTLAFYQKELTVRGWTLPPNYASPSQRGFVGAGNPGYAAYCASGRFMNLNVTGRSALPADARLSINSFPGPCSTQATPMAKQMPPGYDKLPALYAPDGVSLLTLGAPGGPNRWGSEAVTSTTKTAAQLEAHFATQLVKVGWIRVTGAAQGPLAWSTWTLPGEGGWTGFLFALDGGKGQLDLSVRVEQPGALPYGMK